MGHVVPLPRYLFLVLVVVLVRIADKIDIYLSNQVAKKICNFKSFPFVRLGWIRLGLSWF